MQNENKKGFQVRDLIVTALLSVCALVIYILCAFLSFSPYTMLVVSPLWALLAAITYFLVAAKTKKPWALFIFCAVTGIYGFYPPMIICCIIAGIISALIAWKTGCTNGKTLTISYIIYMVLAAFSGTSVSYTHLTTLLGTLPIGAWLYMTGTLPLSDFITCIILPIGFIAPLMRVGKYSEQFNMVKACLDQIREFIEKPELSRPEKNAVLDETAYRFENVSFAYNETEVLKNVSFEIKPCTVSAIVGPSGSGKSTIAKLMAGFWDATKGEVIFGGKNIKEIPFAQLMGEVSYVAQDNFLFDESIRENIRLGKPDATDDEVVAAAKAACCHDFIVNLENGYDTNAGDAGEKLSGGERQRITIARAILKNARVIILDAVSYTHLDVYKRQPPSRTVWWSFTPSSGICSTGCCRKWASSILTIGPATLEKPSPPSSCPRKAPVIGPRPGLPSFSICRS